MPRYRRHYLLNQPVFVTVVTDGREPWLREAHHVECLLSAMREAKEHLPFRHLAHAVLHDHFHWLFEPEDADALSRIVSAVKQNVSRDLKAYGHHGPFWQRRFYDHIIRDERDLHRHLDYIHFNPVRHGLASTAEAYPHTSFHEWRKQGFYEAGWGEVSPPSIDGMNLE